MNRIPLGKNGTSFAFVDEGDYDRLSKHRWHRHRLGYAYRLITNKSKYVGHEYMHRVVVRCPKGLQVDHINRDKLDNRKANLRICGHALNLLNRGTAKNNKSGVTGVGWSPGHQKWHARIGSGRGSHIGYFDDFASAVKARQDALAKAVLGLMAALPQRSSESTCSSSNHGSKCP